MAASWPYVGLWPNITVHIHGVPTGEAAALKIRPDDLPSAMTS
jgi:hypothetical protein